MTVLPASAVAAPALSAQGLLDLLTEQVRDHAVFEIDAHGQILSWNISLVRLFALSPQDPLPALHSLVQGTQKIDLQEMLDTAKTKGRCERLLQFTCPNGRLFRGYTVAKAGAGEQSGHTVVAVRDLSLVSGISDQLESMDSDSVTQLSSSDQFFTLGRVEYKRWRRYLIPFSVVVLEIDQFAELQKGSAEDVKSVLYDSADVLRQCVREVDVIARLHGGVFAALLFNTSIEGASTLAERIRKAIGRVTFLQQLGGKRLSVSLVSSTPQENLRDFDALMTRTATALADLRSQGGDRLALL